MLAKGNDEITICITNIMAMRRGECAYERVKGIDQDIVDEVVDEAEIDLVEDAEFLIEQYEERVSLDDLEIEPVLYEDNTYEVDVVVADREEE